MLDRLGSGREVRQHLVLEPRLVDEHALLDQEVDRPLDDHDALHERRLIELPEHAAADLHPVGDRETGQVEQETARLTKTMHVTQDADRGLGWVYSSERPGEEDEIELSR